MALRPSAIIEPQVGSSEEIERFTKLRIASTITAMPISSISSAMIEGSTLGRISLSSVPRRRAPPMRALST